MGKGKLKDTLLYKTLLPVVVTTILVVVNLQVYAQDAAAGINQANTMVRSYYAAGLVLCMRLVLFLVWSER